MHHGLAGLIVGAALKLDPHPTVALGRAAKAPSHHRICESEKRSIIAALLSQALYVEIKLAVEHRLQPAARNVAIGVAVNGVAYLHVVSRHALRDCPRGAADPEKPAHHFLPCADLRKSAVPARIKINLQRFGMSVDRCLFHGVRTEDLLNSL